MLETIELASLLWNLWNYVYINFIVAYYDTKFNDYCKFINKNILHVYKLEYVKFYNQSRLKTALPL